MKREKILLILGVLTIAVPNLGFSNFVEKIIFAVFGFFLIFIAYGIYFQRNRPAKKKVSRAKIPLTEPKESVRIKEEVTGFTYVNPSSVNDGGTSENANQ